LQASAAHRTRKATAGTAGANFGKGKSMLFSRKPESRNDPSPAPSADAPPASSGAPAPAAAPARLPVRDAAADGALAQSFIDSSLTITGDLFSEGDVHLDGHICGTVRCARLIVGRDAAITGAVAAEQAIVRGRITGTIRSPVVILQETARVESEITYTTLAIDDGATFEGSARRSDTPLQEEETASPLTDLERIMLTAGHSSTVGEREANGFDTSSAAAAGAEPAPPVLQQGDGRDQRAIPDAQHGPSGS
jgi:cytoskeletal protein CcmA (bactofilin family)